MRATLAPTWSGPRCPGPLAGTYRTPTGVTSAVIETLGADWSDWIAHDDTYVVDGENFVVLARHTATHCGIGKHLETLEHLTNIGVRPVTERVVAHPELRIMTAAGVSAGIDMALTLVEHICDTVTAQAIALNSSLTRVFTICGVVDPMSSERAPEPAARRAVWRQAVSVGVASSTYGISFGALATTSGLSATQACVLSLLMFTGGSQFALVGVLAAGGSGLAGTASAVLLGARNGLYALQVSPMLHVRGWRRLLAAHLTIDESTAVATVQRTPALSRLGFWATGASIFVLWNTATLLGALLGDALGDPRQWGLDAAAAGAFLALVWPRLKSGSAAAAAAGAVVVATVTTPLLPPGLPVLAAALFVIPLFLAKRPGGPAAAEAKS